MTTARVMLGLALVLACKGSPSGSDPAWKGLPPGGESSQYFELNPLRDVDLLFVIQNTPGMAAKQKELARTTPLLFEELGKGGADLPNLHVGVITTDLGAGNQPGFCNRPGGDRGIFQPKACGLEKDNFFLSSLNNGTMNNFQGNLADVLSCMVQVGESGCSFPHSLQAARVALYESITPENKGFLRQNAFLAIVVLADRDDCSAETTSALFGQEIPGQSRHLRCALEGHECDGKRPVAVDGFNVPLSRCRAAQTGGLIRVDEIVSSLRALKPRPDQQIFMTAIAGWPSDPSQVSYRFGQNGTVVDQLSLCETVNGPARPAVRINEAVAAFGLNGKMSDVCNSDGDGPARAIGKAINEMLFKICASGPLADVDPAAPGIQPSCQGVLREPAGSGYRDVALPSCRDGGSRPCLRLIEDPVCTASGFAAAFETDGPPAPGAQGQIKCAGTIAPGDAGAGPPACPAAGCPPGRALGSTCALGTAVGLAQAAYRTDAPECPTGLCLKPARDIGVARTVDTQATCTQVCSSDADCADAEVRDRSSVVDKRCVGGYSCAVPFEVGPLCCRKLCVCKDFLPASSVVTPASCVASTGASVCPNRL